MIRILLSKRLGEVRWKQADLARATGIRSATINALYHEMSYSISFENLDLICQALNCTITDIIEYTEPEPGKFDVKMRATLESDQQ